MTTKAKPKAKDGGKAAAKKAKLDAAAAKAIPAADPHAADPKEVDRLARAFERGVCVQVSFGTLGVRKKVRVRRVDEAAGRVSLALGAPNGPADELDDAADGDELDRAESLGVHKVTLRCKEYVAVRRVRRGIRAYLAEVGIPTVLGKAVYVVPIARYREAVEEVDRRLVKLDEAKAAFLDRYEEVKLDAKRRLGALYDERDYPPLAAVRDALWTRVRRGFRISAPEGLRAVDPDAYDRAAEEVRADQAAAAREIRAVLRAAFADVVGHLADRLSGRTDDGRPKTLRASAIENIWEFLKAFEPKAELAGGDGDLKALCDRMRAALKGADVEAVRDDAALREKLGAAAASIKASVDALVVAAPGRAVRWTPKRAEAGA